MLRALSLPAFLVLFSFSMAGVAQATEFLIAEPTIDSAPFYRRGPKIASDGDGFLLVWTENRSNRGSVRAVRLDSAGVVLDEMGIVVADRVGFDSIAVVWAGSEYVVAYGCGSGSANTAVCMSGVDRDGSVRQLGAPLAPAQSPALAWNGRQLLVVVSEATFPSGSRENISRIVFRSMALAWGNRFRWGVDSARESRRQARIFSPSGR